MANSAEAARAIDAVANRLLAIVSRILARLASELGALDTDGDGTLANSGDNERSVLDMRRRVFEIAVEMGLDTIDDEAEAAAARIAAATLRDLQADGAVSAETLAKVDAAVRLPLQRLRRIWQGTADDIKFAADEAVVAALPISDLVDRVEQLLRLAITRSTSAIDAAIMGAMRAATVGATEELEDDEILYLYDGPPASDQKIRPFCEQHVGQVFTLEALNKLDNGKGQPKPVSNYLGGYNCRHTLSPIDREQAIDQGLTIHE